jgi:hypothetical protein
VQAQQSQQGFAHGIRSWWWAASRPRRVRAPAPAASTEHDLDGARRHRPILRRLPPPATASPATRAARLILIWSASYVVSKLALDDDGAGPGDPLLAGDPVCAAAGMKRPRQASATFLFGITTGISSVPAICCRWQDCGSLGVDGRLIAGLIVPLVALGGFLFLGGRLGVTPRPRWRSPASCFVCDASGGSWLGNALIVVVQLRRTRAAAVVPAAACRWSRSRCGGSWSWRRHGAGGARRRLAASRTGVSWSPALLVELAYPGVLATGLAILVGRAAPHPVDAGRLLRRHPPLFAALCGWFWLDDQLTASSSRGGLIVTG